MKKKKVKRKPLKRVSNKKGKFSIINEYKKAFSFIKDSRNFIYISILLFLIFAVIGFFFEDLINSFFISYLKIDLSSGILRYIEEILKETEGMGYSQLLGYIFFRNLQSSFFGMAFGIILGIFPVIVLIANGYLLGFVALLSVKAQGITVLWKIFPHGIFELLAIFISLGLGLRLGASVFKKDKKSSLKKILFNSLKVFLLIIFPLLVIAAVIESALILLLG